jgi:hypothetical protein
MRDASGDCTGRTKAKVARAEAARRRAGEEAGGQKLKGFDIQRQQSRVIEAT